MTFIGLLRGINVGGNNKVPMKQLKATFENAGLANVRTYINSGNIIFEDKHKAEELTEILEKVIAKEFGFKIKMIIINSKQLLTISKAIDKNWVNNHDEKCDVMFLWKDFDKSDVLKKLFINKEVDQVKYVPGAIIWRTSRENFSKSGLHKLIGSDIYKAMTVRNCNTVRKLAELISLY